MIINKYKNYILTIKLIIAVVVAVTLIGLSIKPAQAAFPSTPTTGFPTTDGIVVKVIAASDGSVYVAGQFTTIGGVARNNLARILADGTIDPAFNPNLDVVAYTMLLDSANNTLYVGGEFTTVNGGTTRNRLAAFDTTTGIATAFDPNMDAAVYALALDTANNLLYVGGDFITVNGGTTRNYLAAFDTTTGTANAFDPNMGGGVRTLVLNATNNVLYAGGTFTSVNGGTTRNYLAAFDTTTSTATAFDPNPDLYVFTLLLDSTNNLLYAGGDFTTVNGGTTRNRLAAFDITTGTANAFDPNLNNRARSLVLDSAENTLYVGGEFDTVNGGTARITMAGFDTTTSIVNAFNPVPDGPIFSVAINSDATTIYLGGFYSTIGGGSRQSLSAFGSAPTPVPPTPSPSASTTAATLAPTGQSSTLPLLFASLSLIIGSAIVIQILRKKS